MTPSKETTIWWRQQQKDPSVLEIKRYLEAHVPKLTAKSIDEVALEAKVQAGYRECLERLFVDLLEMKEEVEEEGFMDTSH